jgi:hypothetical protein
MKKELVLIIIVALLFLVGLFSFSLKNIPSNTFVLGEAFYEPLENFVLTESEQGSFVENKNIGLKIVVPTDWKVKKIEGIGVDSKNVIEGAIAVYSPDSEIDEETHLASKGCGVSIRYERRPGEKQYKTIYNVIESLKTGVEQEGYNLVQVSGKDALYEIVIEQEGIGKAIMVSLPIEENIYIFETVIPTNEAERCQKEFSDFLTKIEVSKK